MHTLLPLTAPQDEAVQSGKTTTVDVYQVYNTQCHIDETGRSLICWRWVRNDLKLQCIITSLISLAQRIQSMGICSDSYNCTPFETFKSYRPAPQDEAAQRTIRPPLVRHCYCLTSPAWQWSLVSLWTWRPKYWIPEVNTHICRRLETLCRAGKEWWHTPVWMNWMTTFATTQSHRSLNYLCPGPQ